MVQYLALRVRAARYLSIGGFGLKIGSIWAEIRQVKVVNLLLQDIKIQVKKNNI